MENMKEHSDKQLLEAVDKGCIKSLDEFQSRYRPRIKSLYEKAFPKTQGFLRFSRDDLYEDIEMEVWTKFYKSRLDKDWYFDELDSIGGLVHSCASNLISDKITVALNHRSHLSKEKRMASSDEPKKAISMHHDGFDDNDVVGDTELSFFDGMELPPEFTNKLQSQLDQEEQAIYSLLSKGFKRAQILDKLGLSIDKYNGRREKITKKAMKLLAESSS